MRRSEAWSVNRTVLPSIQADSKLNLVSLQGSSALSYVINLFKTSPPLRDKRVRQAMNYAVDRDAIVKAVLGGRGAPLPGPPSPGWLGHTDDVKPYPYDPERAKALLAEAGHPGEFAFDWTVTEGVYAKDAEIAQAVASHLARVGIKANLQTGAAPPGLWVRPAVAGAIRQLPLQGRSWRLRAVAVQGQAGNGAGAGAVPRQHRAGPRLDADRRRGGHPARHPGRRDAWLGRRSALDGASAPRPVDGRFLGWAAADHAVRRESEMAARVRQPGAAVPGPAGGGAELLAARAAGPADSCSSCSIS